MASTPKIDDLASRFLAAQGLGRSETLRRLFDFLVMRAGEETILKEVEISAQLFGNNGFENGQDTSVRVYIHRLRQKLDDYYSGEGLDDGGRLTIPRGVGYRLVAESMPAAVTAVSVLRPTVRWRYWAIAAGIVALLTANLLAWFMLRPAGPTVDELTMVRASPLWQPLLADGRPIIVVTGDYYIFGEATGADGANRLVREYTINSAEDLDNYLMQHPALMGHYVDLDLFYLPVSIGSALRSIMPVLASTAAARERVRIVQSSDLTPDMLKHNDIVYLGYLSGLGILKEPVFSGSRFSVGDTFDELSDNVGKHYYASQEGGPDRADSKLKDYGYFSTFTGPNGNRIIVIAGTRDIAVMQTAEMVSGRDTLKALEEKAGNAQSYEALYEVEGIRRINLGGHLIMASPLRTDKIWNSQPSALQFPKG